MIETESFAPYTPVMSFFEQLVLIGILLFIFHTFEKRNPIQPNQPANARFANLWLMGLFFILGGGTTFLLFIFIPLPALRQESRSPLVSGLLILLATFLWDLLFYWYHRAEHRFAWLWRLHALHHADSFLNASSSLRHHWLEHPLQAFLIGLPVIYGLHLNTLEAFLFTALTTSWLFFIHTNWRMDLGPFTGWLGGPLGHRLHHSSLAHHRGKNFAVYFPFIDRFFGTYASPSLHDIPPTGIGPQIIRPTLDMIFFPNWFSSKKKKDTN